jgi:hypothetical protein
LQSVRSEADELQIRPTASGRHVPVPVKLQDPAAHKLEAPAKVDANLRWRLRLVCGSITHNRQNKMSRRRLPRVAQSQVRPTTGQIRELTLDVLRE